ncbi:HCNGP-domain-containing protein [Tilletiaria anomala UBC 951]|uniref:HCNGP-domain-containing protein n=1 Tax=Tilletiaria anomala (strain ATCC 24038 / CBS 436.72 / UBC 951) TaxID=1037660 RepID=A0A066WE42_TILAU|nr:HCNGP-domain-containing protein [Tilletiaria anomala UBC 951]KDN50803.1 HCNGP-domain-containing protein [Tilletiaria anomala UBC 951]
MNLPSDRMLMPKVFPAPAGTGLGPGASSSSMTPLSKQGSPFAPNKLGVKKNSSGASRLCITSSAGDTGPSSLRIHSSPSRSPSIPADASSSSLDAKGKGKRVLCGEDEDGVEGEERLGPPPPEGQLQAGRSSVDEDRIFIEGIMPSCRSDGDAYWGLPPVPDTPPDPGLQAKLAEFHRLKTQGTHFNTSLASNRAFRNPHIYAKLVSFVQLDECGSNFASMTSKHAWDPKSADVFREGNAEWLANLQRQELEERQKTQAQGLRSNIEFTSASAPASANPGGSAGASRPAWERDRRPEGRISSTAVTKRHRHHH